MTGLSLAKALIMIALVSGLLSCANSGDIYSDQEYPYSGGKVTVLDDYGDCYLSIKGSITASLEPVMNQALRSLEGRECVETIVIVNSKGGDLATAMHIGEELRNANVTTDIHQYCDSACSFIYVGGARRLAHLSSNITKKTKLGVHQPSSPLFFGRCVSHENDPLAVRKIQNYLALMLPKETAAYFYQAMFGESCKSMGHIDAEVLLETGIATDGLDHH